MHRMFCTVCNLPELPQGAIRIQSGKGRSLLAPKWLQRSDRL
jgi:hypothetical protein